MDTSSDTVAGMDLSGDRFIVEKGMIRNRSKATTADGAVLFRSKRKLLTFRDAFTFTDDDGEQLFTVASRGVARDTDTFVLRDADGDVIATLHNDRSPTTDVWTISDADTDETIATITARGSLNTFARNVIPFGGWIPHEYEITDGDGTHVGTIEGHLSPRDRSEITIDDASPVPRETVIVAAMILNALHGV